MNRGLIQLCAGLGGQLAHVDFARRQHHLLDVAVDEIAIHVGVGKGVVRAQRLDLGDRSRCRRAGPTGEYYRAAWRLARHRPFPSRRGEGTLGGLAIQAEGYRGGLRYGARCTAVRSKFHSAARRRRRRWSAQPIAARRNWPPESPPSCIAMSNPAGAPPESPRSAASATEA